MDTTPSNIPAENALAPCNWLKRTWPLLLAVSCIVALRLVSAYFVPDVFCDEIEVHAHVNSMIATGCDSLGNPHPLYTKEGDGLHTFTYLYPMSLLCRMFGKSIDSMRLLQQILTVLSCLLLAAAARKWGGGERRFWTVLVVSLTLPWGFLQANRVWDPALVPLYFSVAFWFSTQVLRGGPGGAKTRHVVAASVFLVLLATLYPPDRIPAVWMWLWLFFTAWREGKATPRQLALAVAVSALVSLPMVVSFFCYPGFNARPVYLFVFRGRPLGVALQLMAKSFAGLFNADFLFATGDLCRRHSLPVLGMLGPLSVVPLWAFVRRVRATPLPVLLAGVILTTYFADALTVYDYNSPNSLRSCMAWMPWAVFLACGWDWFLEGRSRAGRVAWYAAYAVWFAVYFGFYMHYNA